MDSMCPGETEPHGPHRPALDTLLERLVHDVEERGMFGVCADRQDCMYKCQQAGSSRYTCSKDTCPKSLCERSVEARSIDDLIHRFERAVVKLDGGSSGRIGDPL